MDLQRPDLSQATPAIRAYIEALETEIERLRVKGPRPKREVAEEAVEEESLPPLETTEPPTSFQIITATASGLAKRTYRHLYTRQRRGGMGVFGMELPKEETPAILSLVDEGQSLLLLTNQARAFRMPLNQIPEEEVHARGEPIIAKLNLNKDERLAAILPVQAQGYIAMVSQRGMVRLLRHHVFGEYMKAGATLYDEKAFGPLACAAWTPGDSDLLIVTRQGKAIRFSEKLVPPQGGPGIRLSDGDEAVALTPVYGDSGVFMLSADGRGTIRLMEGFIPNKAPGAGGKIAMNTDELVGAATVESGDEIFIISRLGKVIRFSADEVPPKDGVVQGVNCMSFRLDSATALVVSKP
jgi:DNA gyrase subunit A